MELREAVSLAKNFVHDTFRGENITDVGLEEIRFDDADDRWKITVGFVRPRTLSEKVAALNLTALSAPRTYKVVEISNSDGSVKAMVNRAVD